MCGVDRIVLNDKLKDLKGIDMTCFKALSHNVYEETEKNYENHQRIYSPQTTSLLGIRYKRMRFRDE